MKASRLQYLNGQANYLDYLSAWTNVQSLERQLVGREPEELAVDVEQLAVDGPGHRQNRERPAFV